MRELGEHSDEAHAGLAEPVREAKVELLILVGKETRPLETALAGTIAVTVVADASQASEALLAAIGPGDAVLVKASNGVGLARLVERVAGA
jgi:UDP-N-acetylmuramoyl-tripeptide--D-alanyl-D-alanine ligase